MPTLDPESAMVRARPRRIRDRWPANLLLKNCPTGEQTELTNIDVEIRSCSNMSEAASSSPLTIKFDDEAYKHLWDWAMKQDQRTYDQFGLGIVGIGALFFAYGSVHVHTVQILVASIGLGGSIILWDQMYGARQEFYRAMELLKDCNPNFRALMHAMDGWRDKGRRNRWIYQPASRLMVYFMALVSGAWMSVILSLFGVPLIPWILILDLEMITIIIIMTTLRKLEDRNCLQF